MEQSTATAAEPTTLATSTPDIRLSGVRKVYGEVVAVAGIDLEVRRGEFFTLLGPSGSGKTTTLRMIAGFELPDAGKVELAGRDGKVAEVPAWDHPLGVPNDHRPNADYANYRTAGLADIALAIL
ncbi:MAG TPA: ATP-binding cassette domain-containing protein, partial [Geminicoccaceae bacterium]|nr:ATP-binding cassette domain-containing protein [Geminicoccaceae bacterium]